MKAVKLLLLFAIILVYIMSLHATLAPTLRLNITTDKQVYNVGEKVSISGNLTKDGTLVSDALVCLEVDNPKNELLMIRTFITGQTSTSSWPVEVTSLTPSDSSGNPIYNVQPGGNVGFKFSIKNNAASKYPVIVALSLFYCNGAPFTTFVAFNGTLDGGQSITVLVWPVPIPMNAPVGTAYAYASVLNNLPKNNGLAYSPETLATFIIGSRSSTSITTLTSNQGMFNLTLPLQSTSVMLGNYTIYAITYYSLQIASDKTTFKVILVGDLDNNGKIDMKDVAIVAKAFGTVPGDARWNPKADLNPDNKIDMKDIAIVARAFGTTAVPDP